MYKITLHNHAYCDANEPCSHSVLWWGRFTESNWCRSLCHCQRQWVLQAHWARANVQNPSTRWSIQSRLSTESGEPSNLARLLRFTWLYSVTLLNLATLPNSAFILDDICRRIILLSYSLSAMVALWHPNIESLRHLVQGGLTLIFWVRGSSRLWHPIFS